VLRSCCGGDDWQEPQRCHIAPLCSAIHVAVGTVDQQAIELGWAPDHQQGRLVAVHVHEAGLPSFAVDVPLGIVLLLWRCPQSLTRTWRDQRTQRNRTSHVEVLGDGSILLKCTAPDAGVLVPASLLPSFKEAIGLLLRLADKTVGIFGPNLTDAGGSMTTAACCHICSAERACRTSPIGITFCAVSAEGAIGRTASGYFVHIDGHAATMVRIDGGKETDG
jgi:hypothetical protein